MYSIHFNIRIQNKKKSYEIYHKITKYIEQCIQLQENKQALDTHVWDVLCTVERVKFVHVDIGAKHTGQYKSNHHCQIDQLNQ